MDRPDINENCTRLQVHLPFGNGKEKAAAIDTINFIKSERISRSNQRHRYRGLTHTPLGPLCYRGEWLSVGRWVPDALVVLTLDLPVGYQSRELLLAELEFLEARIREFYKSTNNGRGQDVIYISVFPIGCFEVPPPSKCEVSIQVASI